MTQTSRRERLLRHLRSLRGDSPTLADLWDYLARLYGDDPFVHLAEPLHGSASTTLSFVECRAWVARIAGALVERGVKQGDRVALCSPNRFSYPLAIFAINRLGALAIPLHHGLKAREVEERVAQADARFLIGEPELESATGGAFIELTTLLGEAADAREAPAASVARDETLCILYTSGTTGRPKGAKLSSASLIAMPRIAQWLPQPFEISGIYALPTAHIMGLNTVLMCAFAGAPLWWNDRFQSSVVLDTIEREQPSFFVGVPAMYGMLLRDGAETRDLKSIKLWFSGADAMPAHWVRRFAELGGFFAPGGIRIGSSVFAELYGMVELSGPAILKVTPSRPLPGVTQRVSRLGRAVAERLGLPETGEAVAIPIPPYRAKVISQSGAEQPAGEVGELCLRGPGVLRGYDGDADATRAAAGDGWLRTGDLARRGRLGEITFVGREKDVIKHGGFSVFPAQVEAELLEHPDVQEAVVVGAPHETKGAVPVAVVALRPGSETDVDALLEWCRTNIAGYRSPRALAITTPEAIPRNDNRKVLKNDVRERWLPDLREAFPGVFE